MRILIRLFALMSLWMLPSGAHAFFFGNWCCGNITLDAEWLYLRPSFDNIVTTESMITPGSMDFVRKVNVLPYQSGWRVAASYEFCDCLEALSVRWTQLNADHQRNLSGTLAGQISTTSASDKKEFDYHAFEGLFSHRIYCDCQFNVNLFSGVQYAWINNKELFTDLTNPQSFFKQIGHFWGVGPELGIALNYYFCGGFSLTGRGSTSLLISREHASLKINSFASTHVSIDPLWRIVSTWDLRFGLRYDCGFSCMNFYVEGGYEAISYIHAVPVLITNADMDLIFSNADMHGPYVAGGITF